MGFGKDPYEAKDITKRGPMTILCHEGKNCVVEFDLCRVIDCSGDEQAQLMWNDKYICNTEKRCRIGAHYYNTDGYWRCKGGFWGCNCQEWSSVLVNTGSQDWGYEGYIGHTFDNYSTGLELKSRMSLIKASSKAFCEDEKCNPLILTLKDPIPGDSRYLVLGICRAGEDALGPIRLLVIPKPKITTNSVTNSGSNPTAPPLPKPSVKLVKIVNITTLVDTFAVETGFEDRNEWLNWMLYTAKHANQSNCYACSSARPHLGTVPLPFNRDNDLSGLKCIVSLFSNLEGRDDNCAAVHYLYPIVEVRVTPPIYAPYPGNYPCFEKAKGEVSVGQLSWCGDTVNVGNDTGGFKDVWFTNQTVGRADIWWMCAPRQLRSKLPASWRGR
ncbi:uncharacterized protein LOC134319419 [Trichomycterus rosablanca]|uniref:uncharacterized protein LOC134319419 n=1 Tax=Trichomycterus rosablanca TaxID=2290929 RepID=UPI002F359323